MRFIRKNGRIIPIAGKGETIEMNPKSNLVKSGMLAPPEHKNTVLQRFKTGYARGAILGLTVGALTSGSLLKGAAIGGGLGGFGRAALGSKNIKEKNMSTAEHILTGAAVVGSGLIAAKALGIKSSPFTKARVLGIMKRGISKAKVWRTQKGREGNVIFGRFPKK